MLRDTPTKLIKLYRLYKANRLYLSPYNALTKLYCYIKLIYIIYSNIYNRDIATPNLTQAFKYPLEPV